MSRNLARTDCYFCPSKTVKLVGPPTAFADKYSELANYHAEYSRLIVSDAECPLCGAQYTAWLNRPSGWPGGATSVDANNYVDLSFRSTFDDEANPPDLPIYWVEQEHNNLRRGVWDVCGYTSPGEDHEVANCRQCTAARAWRLDHIAELQRRRARLVWSDWDNNDVAQEIQGALIEQPKSPTGNVDYPSVVVITEPAQSLHAKLIEFVQGLKPEPLVQPSFELAILRGRAEALQRVHDETTAQLKRAIYWLCRVEAVIDYICTYGDPYDLDHAPGHEDDGSAHQFLNAIGYDEAKRSSDLEWAGLG